MRNYEVNSTRKADTMQDTRHVRRLIPSGQAPENIKSSSSHFSQVATGTLRRGRPSALWTLPWTCCRLLTLPARSWYSRGMIEQGKQSGYGFGGGSSKSTEQQEAPEIDVSADMIDENQEQDEVQSILAKKPKKLTARASETEIKHAAALVLAENGMSYGAIGKAIERHPQTVTNLVVEKRKHSLASPDMQKLARATVKSVMAGWHGKREKGADGKVIVTDQDARVSARDALAASKMVADRAEPVNEPGTGAAAPTFIQVNIGQYQPKNE